MLLSLRGAAAVAAATRSAHWSPTEWWLGPWKRLWTIRLSFM
jgi:hypothetical protein